MFEIFCSWHSCTPVLQLDNASNSQPALDIFEIFKMSKIFETFKHFILDIVALLSSNLIMQLDPDPLLIYLNYSKYSKYLKYSKPFECLMLDIV